MELKEKLNEEEMQFFYKNISKFESEIYSLTGRELLEYSKDVFNHTLLNNKGVEYNSKSKSTILIEIRKVAREYYANDAKSCSGIYKMLEECGVVLDSDSPKEEDCDTLTKRVNVLYTSNRSLRRNVVDKFGRNALGSYPIFFLFRKVARNIEKIQIELKKEGVESIFTKVK